MSNHLAIATVTAALGQLVHGSAQEAVSGVALQLGRPSAPTGGTTARSVFVYLFQVSPNAALRNTDLPTRNAAGQVTKRPQAALDLHYLITFVGDDRLLEPQRMLGAVVRDLHSRPVLSRTAIQNAITSTAELADSDVADAIEHVKFTPTPLPLEETSKLWSVMLQTPYMLSLIYQASVVLIDGLETGVAALPVLQRGEGDRGVDTQVGMSPRLAALWLGSAAALARLPKPASLPNVALGLRVQIAGTNLGGDAITVRFAHPRLAPIDVDLTTATRSAEEIVVALPDDAPAQSAWAAGIFAISVSARRGSSTRNSNALPLALAPHVTAVSPNPAPRDGSGGVTLTVTCQPQVLPEQSVVLLLADREIAAQPLAAASASLTFQVPDAPALSSALLRLRVDGVESMPFFFDEPTHSFVFDPAQRITIT